VVAASRGPGSASLAALKRELAAGWPPGLVVLTGDDLYHVDRAQRALIEALVPAEAAGFGLTVFGDAAVDLGVVLAAARSVGMFAPRRVVLVREVAVLDGDPEGLVAYAARPPAASHLIVRAPELDRRRKLHQALVQNGRLLEFVAGNPHDTRARIAEVAELARRAGLALDAEAQALIAEIGGGDLYRVESEIAKLAAWAGREPGRTLTTRDIAEVVVGSASFSGWEVASALLRADRGEALAALRKLLDGGEEPLRLLGGLASRARAMLQARAMVARGERAEVAVRSARIWGDPQAASCLARHDLERLLEFPALLLEADRTLKSRGLDPGAVLGAMIERMLPEQPRPGLGRRR
jgi:DNA polymerase-3 subunit delta